MTQAQSAPKASDTVAWYALEPDEVLKQQGVDPEAGLSSAEVDSRRAKVGLNKFAEAAKEPRWQRSCASTATRCRSCCWSPASSACSCPSQFGTGILLIVLTLFNAVMGLNQEGKAEASVAALQKMMIVKARVRRDGELVQIADEELVPGDIVNDGGRRPRPGGRPGPRAATLEIDESALTGESVPVPKRIEAVAAEDSRSATAWTWCT